MGRNVRVKDDGQIKFNLYGHSIEKGKLVKGEVIKERFYANFVSPKTQSKGIVDSTIRARGEELTIITKGMFKSIEEDDFVENCFTKEVFRIDRIEAVLLYVNTQRPIYERTLYLKR